jgi:hypothetical protein
VLHHFFSYFPKPAFFAKTGMYRCISPETSMFLTTIFYMLLIPIEIVEFYPRRFLAAQLNNFEGRFLQPLNRSAFLPTGNQIKFWEVIILYKPGISSGLSCKSASIVITHLGFSKPACKACDLPKFFMKRPFTFDFQQQIVR